MIPVACEFCEIAFARAHYARFDSRSVAFLDAQFANNCNVISTKPVEFLAEELFATLLFIQNVKHAGFHREALAWYSSLSAPLRISAFALPMK